MKRKFIDHNDYKRYIPIVIKEDVDGKRLLYINGGKISNFPSEILGLELKKFEYRGTIEAIPDVDAYNEWVFQHNMIHDMKKKEPKIPQWVYVYNTCDSENGDDFIYKIGIAKDLHSRTLGLSSSNPKGYTKMAFKFDERKKASGMERYLHTIFSEKLVYNELFSLNANDLDTITDKCFDECVDYVVDFDYKKTEAHKEYLKTRKEKLSKWKNELEIEDDN